jgi:DTW domain-containing protein YfiP
MISSVIRCIRCRQRHCVCSYIVPVETRTRFVVVRHFSERRRVSNTAHYAAMAMPNCRVLDYADPHARFDETLLPNGEGTCLLYPDEGGVRSSEPPSTVIVLDGSWSQARRMRQRIGALRGLPVLRLAPPVVARARLRRPLLPEGMSTLEAIARVVAMLEGEARAAPLDRLYDTIVEADARP